MSYQDVTEVAVENLQVGDIATFRQGGKVALYKKHLHEKVTNVTDDPDDTSVLVTTVNKKGIEDQYLIPNGTVMRVHFRAEAEDYDVPAEDADGQDN
jgi:hypothetical protein